MCPAFRARSHAPFAPLGVAVPRPAAVRRRRRRRCFHSLVSRGSCADSGARLRPRTGEQGRSCKRTPGACTRPLAGALLGAAGVRQMPPGTIRPNRRRTANINCLPALRRRWHRCRGRARGAITGESRGRAIEDRSRGRWRDAAATPDAPRLPLRLMPLPSPPTQSPFRNETRNSENF